MKVAFFKGTKSGLAGIYNRIVRFVTNSKYSHCELVFSEGLCASASYMDGGVRFKEIHFEEGKWDFIELPEGLEVFASNWFIKHQGQKYDLLGNLTFIWFGIRQDKSKWFCSEAIAASLGITDSWRYTPALLASTLLLMAYLERNSINSTPTK